jgi:dephospho-CoA kinase
MTQAPLNIPNLVLTGGIGSGKSAAAQAFEDLGIPVIDSDAIAHAITAPGGAAINAIQALFGPEMITPEGAMDRSKMREKVFNDPHALKTLESITHPMIRGISEQAAQQAMLKKPPYILFMIPLLFESEGWQERFKKVIVVDCSIDLQIDRVIKRNHLQKELIEKIIASQAPRSMRVQYANYVILNEGTLNDLSAEVLKTHQKILAELQ